jgi:MFS family permease
LDIGSEVVLGLDAAMPTPLLIAGAASSGLTIGFIPALVDCVAAPVCQQLKTSPGKVSRVLAIFYICWLPAMPLCGWLLDHWRTKEILFFGLLACALGITWLGLALSFRSLLSSVILLGIGYSAVATAGIRFMASALKLTDQSSEVAALNLGFVFVVIGAVAAPWIAGVVQRRWGYRQGLLYLSLGAVIAACLVFFVSPQLFPEARANGAWMEMLKSLPLWLLAAIVLLYFALENCLDVWPEPYLKELGYRGRSLTAGLLIFWGAFTLLRVAVGWLPGTGYEIWLLLGLLLASAFTMGNLVGANEYSSGSVGFWLTGACYGPLLPGFLALVMELDLPGTALGMMLAMSGLDTLVVRPAMTALARRSPARTVMRVPVVLALVMAAPLLVLALIR